MKIYKLVVTLLIVIIYFGIVGLSSASVVGLLGAFTLLASKRKLWFD